MKKSKEIFYILALFIFLTPSLLLYAQYNYNKNTGLIQEGQLTVREAWQNRLMGARANVLFSILLYIGLPILIIILIAAIFKKPKDTNIRLK